jgi:serine/threonine protein kinase
MTKLEFIEQIKDYKLGAVIGRGTYSVVRAAKNKEGRKVAIKTYLKSSLSNEDRRKNL